VSASALAQLSAARQALAAATTVPDLKLLRDQAQTIQDYVRRQHLGLEQQNEAAEIKIQCERRLGDLLKATVRHEGGRPNGNDALPFRGLPEGVSKMQSHRWQVVASVPAAAFEAWLVRTREAGEELTTAGLLAFAPVAIFDAEQKLDLAPGGCDDGCDDPQADDEPPSPTSQYIRMVRLFLTTETQPRYLAQERVVRRMLGTGNVTDTAAALMAWAYSLRPPEDDHD
jgi:hypothetical protein